MARDPVLMTPQPEALARERGVGVAHVLHAGERETGLALAQRRHEGRDPLGGVGVVRIQDGEQIALRDAEAAIDRRVRTRVRFVHDQPYATVEALGERGARRGSAPPTAADPSGDASSTTISSSDGCDCAATERSASSRCETCPKLGTTTLTSSSGVHDQSGIRTRRPENVATTRISLRCTMASS